jgi:hypothetical protein
MQAARLPLQGKPAIADCDSLDENRRSVSEKAPLQDQFGERKCAGWSGVE